jgi:adenine-specific DNA-methyltransferase
MITDETTVERITIDSKESKSLDMTQENIDQLQQLFPEVFQEGKIDFDALKAVLGEHIETSDERYNFTWNGKNKARQIALTPSTGTLRPCKADSVNWDSTENLFIEGDNLEVLKLLQKSYHKKVKMIYIDPPYNTGKDFVYKDNFRDNMKNYLEQTGQVDSEGKKLGTNSETSGRYHSDWLNMMYPRLKLARNLLKDDGVIFISIDDNEVANLRNLCNEIFGEDNFINNVIWQKKYTRSNDAKWFSDNHDHILVYAKSKDNFKLNLLPRNEDQLSAYRNPDNHSKGLWKATPLHAKSGNNTQAYTFKNGVTWSPPKGTFRRYNDVSMEKMDLNNEIWFGENIKQIPSRKSFLCDVKNGVTAVTIWPHDEVGHNHEANNELKELGLGGVFDNPKPTKLIERMITLSEKDKDSIILDFFAGSGTTAQSVMNKNKEDNGNRKFILVQLPEAVDKQSSAYKSGYPRISDFTAARLKKVCSNLNSGMKYFKLDYTNIRPWDIEAKDLQATLEDSIQPIKPDRNAEDVLYEILLKYGIELTTPIETHTLAGAQVFSMGCGALMVCLADNLTLEMIEAIAKLKQQLDPESTQVVFKDAGFQTSNLKTNAIQILKQAGIDDVKSI